MPKSVKRDAQLLLYIARNQKKLTDAINHFKCDFSQTQNSLANNEMAFDLCSMYMAQIGENVKNLTDESRTALSEVVNTEILRYFRNRIDHDYEKVNKPLLQAYIQQMIAPKTIQLIQEQYKSCITSDKK